MSPLKIAFFGSSLVSAYWNGAATYYRGIIRALAERGHQITFYEPDAYNRQAHRDIENPDWARVVVYPENEKAACKAVEEAGDSDLVIKASGVGVFDALLERAVLEHQSQGVRVIFWDVDAPATLDRMIHNPDDSFIPLVPEYDLVLTYGGGDPVVERYREMGARDCVPIYNALDPSTHHPVPRDDRFRADLGFVGNRLPDREKRVDEFFFTAACHAPDQKFILGGSGWETRTMPRNVDYFGHVFTRDHNSFNCTPKAVLNINRESMARYGFSPPTRIFEAAGAGACLITDAWKGIELFLEPGREVLVAHNGKEVADWVSRLRPDEARSIGEAARQRILSAHTYQHRAEQLEKTLEPLFERKGEAA